MGAEPNGNTIHIASGTIIKIIVIGLLFVALFILRDLLLVLLAAIVVASSVEPMAKWFINRRIPRLPAVIFIYVAIAILLIGAFYFILLPLLSESSNLLASLPELVKQSSVPEQASTFLNSESAIVEKITDTISLGSALTHINQLLSSLASGFWSGISTVFGGLLSFVLIIVLSFYLSVQDDGVGKFLKVVTPRRHEAYVVGLWNRVRVKIGLWMQGQLILAITIGVLVYLGLALFGVKHALLLAVLAGLFELIPLFGPILAAIPAVVLGFVDGGLTMALLLAGFYIVIQQFENHLIYPLVVKKVVGVSPIVVIVALVAGAQLAGFLGLLLSVPVATMIMEFINDIEHEKTPK